MKKTLAMIALAAACFTGAAVAQQQISHVLLISVDGMHAVDFLNCANGIS